MLVGKNQAPFILNGLLEGSLRPYRWPGVEDAVETADKIGSTQLPAIHYDITLIDPETICASCLPA